MKKLLLIFFPFILFGQSSQTSGCTDNTACNYDSFATIDDNSCVYAIDIYGVDYVNCNGDCVNDIDVDGVCDEVEVIGCTDLLYLEYNPLATEDDGSCLTLLLDGCTDASACNYNENATDDDGSCTYPSETYLDCNGDCINDSDGDSICDELEIVGCTDLTACNYNENATDYDGSCVYPLENYLDCNGDCINDTDGDGVCNEVEIIGCQDTTACNYDLNATDDDGSCTYPSETYLDCNGDCINDGDGDSICDELEIVGCTDLTACNFNLNATDDDGSCAYPSENYLDCNGDCVSDSDGDSICDELEILGCTDSSFIEYDLNATDDDGSCLTLIIIGCTDDNALNYDLTANVDDNSCIYEGCTDLLACNFDSNASLDDGSCLFIIDIYGIDYVDCDGNCLNDNDGDDVCDEEEVGACTDPLAYNYDPLADEDDGSCLYLGCIEITACNYNLLANIDDGSCVFPIEDYLDCNGDCINDFDNDAICDELEIFGCTDPQADNFDSESTQEDGSCFYLGCTDETACNYDPNATNNDGSCNYPEYIYLDCDGDCINDTDLDEVCDELELLGCTDELACNYDLNATEDNDSCTYPETGFDCDGNCSDDDVDGFPDDYDGDGICDYVDNCFYDFNPGQEDLDGDDEGDVCDSDDGLSLNEQVEHSLLVFPNPTNGIINIEYLPSRNDVLILKIINAIGQIIEIVELNTIGSYVSCSFDIKSFEKGVYQIYLLDAEKVIVEKVFLN